MKLKEAIRGQYHAGLEQLRQTVALCPDHVWTGGEHPRNYWRIAYHAAFYTHLYMAQNLEAFQAWERARAYCELLWEKPNIVEAYTRADILEYIQWVDARVDVTVDSLDLESEETGFDWYKGMTKLDHELMNLRHLQGHVGQLSELLMAHGVDIDWVAKLPRTVIPASV